MVFIIGPTDSVYTPVRAIAVASSATPSDPGPSGGTFRAEMASTAKTNEMTSKIGPVAVQYEPELMSFLSGEV